MSLLLLFPQGGAAVGIDIREVLVSVYPSLNAAGAADLTWWTETELFQYIDEAAKRLASRVGLFVERDATTIVLANGTQEYSLPTRHLSTIHASAGPAASLAPITPATAHELEALDTTWETASGVVERYVHRLGPDKVQVYKVPGAAQAGQVVAVIFHQYPADLSPTAFVLTAPSPFREYFTFAVLAEARKIEGDAAMPEVSQQCEAWMNLLEKVFLDYWGGSQ